MNIKAYSSLGGKARAAKLDSNRRAVIAKIANMARLKKYNMTDRQATLLTYSAEEYNELKRKYIAVATFLTAQGFNIERIIASEGED